MGYRQQIATAVLAGDTCIVVAYLHIKSQDNVNAVAPKSKASNFCPLQTSIRMLCGALLARQFHLIGLQSWLKNWALWTILSMVYIIWKDIENDMEKPWMMLCCSPGDRLRMNGIFKNKLLLIPPLLHYCSEENMVIGSSSFFFLNGFLLHLSMVTCYTSVRALGLGNRQVMRKPYVYI